MCTSETLFAMRFACKKEWRNKVWCSRASDVRWRYRDSNLIIGGTPLDLTWIMIYPDTCSIRTLSLSHRLQKGVKYSS
jgi:hypothetical protein